MKRLGLVASRGPTIDARAELATRLRRIRSRAGLTQEQLAERAELSVRTVRAAERAGGPFPRPTSVRRIAEALGLSPAQARELTRLGLDDGADARPVLVTSWLPSQLPPAVSGFVGRERELAGLDGLLSSRPLAGPTVGVCAVSGMAGVGKTALSVYWAHRVADRFPDGQLYVNLRGFDPGGRIVSAVEAVRGFLDALGVPAHRVPDTPTAQVALYRSLLAGRRMLVLLDNAADAAQVRLLLPGGPGCLVVVTSRNQLAGLVASEGAHPIRLDPLPATDAGELLASRIGVARAAAEPEAVSELVGRCGGLPLALAILAARVSTRPHLALGAVTRDLSRGLGPFAGDDAATDLRSAFSWSYRALTPPAARVFRLLGLHPGPTVGTMAAAGLAAVPVPEAGRALDELVDANLITEMAGGRYAVHDLVRTYATELTQAVDPEAERRAATQRMLEHLHATYAAAPLVRPAMAAFPVGSAPPAV